MHETFFEAAYQDARSLDMYYAEHKMPLGPLHGLPVSLKDQFHIKGVETTMGYVGWIGTFMGKKGTGQEKVFESEMVKELRASGAVLYCKTSVPHSLSTSPWLSTSLSTKSDSAISPGSHVPVVVQVAQDLPQKKSSRYHYTLAIAESSLRNVLQNPH